MRTNFSPAQLADPRIADANRILETCVHYGFCTNVCPTYVVTGDENDSPRGRIDLIHAMLERGGAPSSKTVHHLDRCLSCLACITTCAVKVDYAHLIDHARSHIERHYRRPFMDRMTRHLLAAVLPRPRAFLMLLRFGQHARLLRRLLPRKWRGMLDMIPARLRPDILSPGEFKSDGSAQRRVALLPGCAQQALEGAINAASLRVLTRHGCEVVVAAGTGCCGSLVLHMGRERDALAAARANVTAWSRELAHGLDAVVINASGCGTTVKDYGRMFAREPELADAAKRVAARARDISEVLADVGLQVPSAALGYRVAYHDPCSLQHGQHVTNEPRALLRAAGFEVIDVPEKHFCCGSAGTYNLLQPEMADVLGRRKAAHITSTGPDIVATGNIGCIVQLRRFLAVPVVHTVELLDWATGGPRPRALEGLREPEASGRPAAAQASEAANELGVW
jgi:glycolate oxidase iron-sulfur subunit